MRVLILNTVWALAALALLPTCHGFANSGKGSVPPPKKAKNSRRVSAPPPKKATNTRKVSVPPPKTSPKSPINSRKGSAPPPKTPTNSRKASAPAPKSPTNSDKDSEPNPKRPTLSLGSLKRPTLSLDTFKRPTLSLDAFKRPTLSLKRATIPLIGKENSSEPSDEAKEKAAAALLKRLDLRSSTEPKMLSVAPGALLDVITASIPAVFRLGSGAFANGYKLSLADLDEKKYSFVRYAGKQLVESCPPVGPMPLKEPIILYEFEGCPYCKKVREACSILSLTVTFRPCPKNGIKFRPEIKSKYGKKATFPFMIDPNTSVQMFESDEIIKYLFTTYGNRAEVPKNLLPGTCNTVAAGLGLVLGRFGKGSSYSRSDPPSLPLKLWLYESSPFGKLVKEKLVELELEHTVVYAPRGSPNRQALYERTDGRFQVPYLEDPNTFVSMFESQAIVEYLEKRYALEDFAVEYL